MPDPARELIVFPTELSLRRFQQELALANGWVDASCHTTFARLRQVCHPYAQLKGRPMGTAKELLVRRQVVEVALGHFVDGGVLGQLSPAALAGVLEQLVTELSALPEESTRIVDWLLNHSPKHKLYQLGILYSVWRATIQQEGFADQLDVNAAILKLLKGNRQNWPPLLRDAKRLTFRSVRWFNPFEESCVVALNQKLKVRIESALPAAHAEKAEDRLGQQIRSEIMGQPWAVWAEDLGDALAVDSPDVLQLDNADRIDFSRSAGAYGEIEDLARRICWNIQTLDRAPNRIALVVPNIGTVQDIIPHVFGRFQIPYYFRRGRPVLSSPCVKAFLAWLAFPLTARRDQLIDLVRNPAIQFENREATVQQLLKMPPRLEQGLSRKSAPHVEQAFQPAHSGMKAARILAERIVPPEDHFNTEALAAVSSALESFGEQPMPLRELIDLLEELLEDATVRPRESHEQGVWVLNPHDAVGLDFDLVLFAGLNEGEFSGVPQQDALLSDSERHFLRKHLEDQGRHLPKLALPTVDALLEQESVLFLTALGMAHEQLVLSYQAVDQEGNEKGAGEYYRKLWNLAGWPAQEEVLLSPYDQWRIERFGGESVFSNHWKTQRLTDPADRVPMPGESFLPVVPLALCRAKDEALQVAVQQNGQTRMSAPHVEQAFQPAHPAGQVVAMLNIEAEREAFLDMPISERIGSVYCGHIPALKEKIAAWFENKGELSPTALETLAQCRYVFLLDRIFGLRDPRTADDTPDPMDRGTLIHAILKEIYETIANGEAGIDAPRYWAVKTDSGWRRRTEPGMDAIPLAVLVPEHMGFAREVAVRRIKETPLGHPGVWAAEQEKVLEQVLNFVRYDVDTCAAENRFPALFELTFGGDTAVALDAVKLHGKIDRVDLVFAETGELQRVRVLDYKGSSRVRSKTEDYMDEIRRNLDCQLPVYAFAAQQRFFGECNTEQANAMTEAGYLFYQRDYAEIKKTLAKSLVRLDEPGLVDGFLATLFENIRRLKMGDFSVDPLIETYTDYKSVCRTDAVAREDLET
ncbi:MAG: PD-(D/E)XK nuclease family protein [Kiritimatiellales bacterium]|nr:PD-(D/E)XK nuclease family protein [Kiritimatiellales bacterium]